MAHFLLYQITMLLLIFITTPSTMSSTILDADGEPLLAGVTYYALPPYTGIPYGGLNLSPIPGTACPNYVGQYTSDKKRGRPIKFSIPSNPLQREVTENTEVTITFEMPYNKTKCGISTGKWVVANNINVPKRYLIEVGNSISLKKSNNYGSKFKLSIIELFVTGRVSKMVHCFEEGEDNCMQVAIGFPGVPGLQILDFTPLENNHSVPFVFKKASSMNRNYYYY